MGHQVDIVPLYETLPAEGPPLIPEENGDLKELPFDLVTLTSASVAKGVAQMAGKETHRLSAVSIGPITTKAARELGFHVLAESPVSTIPSLVETVVLALSAKA
jgi:uroporphyrinogen-III synthase